MKSIASTELRRLAVIGGGLVTLALATGAAFAGWLQHGAAIFLSLAEAGLRWCL